MKIKKSTLTTVLIILAIIIVAAVVIYLQDSNNNPGVSASLAKCIGSHSQLYVQLGCHFCAEQEALFGKSSYQYLNTTDYHSNPQIFIKLGIRGTPTWIINGTQYAGVQSIDKLKNLTGC